MSLLTRYLIRNNLFLVFSILLIGTGLYVLTDLFERLDYFLDASLGLAGVLWFYCLKIPFIAGQILPAVFLIAIIVQFCLMIKARELTALQSGGVSPFVLLRFVIIYGGIWAFAQLALAQGLGVTGDKLSSKMWREEVKGHSARDTEMNGLWFIDKSYVVYLGIADPVAGDGKDFLAYQLSRDGKDMLQMVRAESFTVKGRVWRLKNATVITPASYGYEVRPEMTIPLTQNLAAFLAIDPSIKPTHLPVWDLRESIASLKKSGSNVEVLRTTLHSRFAYAASLMAMGVLGLAIVLWKNNVYLAVGIGLVFTFLVYVCTTLCVSLGEKGALNPVFAAWFPVSLFFGLGLFVVLWQIRPRCSLS